MNVFCKEYPYCFFVGYVLYRLSLLSRQLHEKQPCMPVSLHQSKFLMLFFLNGMTEVITKVFAVLASVLERGKNGPELL